MHAFYQHPLSCARASNPLTRWFSHPRRKQRGIENLFRKRPASKTKFYLLDAEIETILRNARIKEIQPEELVDTYGMAVWRSESPEYKELYRQKYRDFHTAADAALKPHIIQTIVTDSKGKARFKVLTPGTYYLFGIAKINKGISIIRSPVEVKVGENTFTF